jgi:hypothetical protein
VFSVAPRVRPIVERMANGWQIQAVLIERRWSFHRPLRADVTLAAPVTPTRK